MKLQDTDQYVVIEPSPDAYPIEMRWIATPGTPVRINYGLRTGATGIIVGEARSRRAHRVFCENRDRAIAERRPMTDDDYGILIDNEGPLVLMDNPDDAFDRQSTGLDWFPGQASICLSKI